MHNVSIQHIDKVFIIYSIYIKIAHKDAESDYLICTYMFIKLLRLKGGIHCTTLYTKNLQKNMRMETHDKLIQYVFKNGSKMFNILQMDGIII